MRTLANRPVLLPKNVRLQSTLHQPGIQGPPVPMRTRLQKLQATLTGAGQWRPAVPGSLSGMNGSGTKRNPSYQKTNDKYYPGTRAQVPSWEDIAFVSDALRMIHVTLAMRINNLDDLILHSPTCKTGGLESVLYWVIASDQT